MVIHSSVRTIATACTCTALPKKRLFTSCEVDGESLHGHKGLVADMLAIHLISKKYDAIRPKEMRTGADVSVTGMI